jgi:hypothetical protein
MNRLCWVVMIAIVMVVCGATANESVAGDPKTARIKAFELVLSLSSEACMLTYTAPHVEGSIDLQLPPPCDFHRSLDGKVRLISLRETDILLVESSRPNPKHPSDCETRIQGIKLTAQRVVVSRGVSRVAACPPFQWDEKMFTGFFD